MNGLRWLTGDQYKIDFDSWGVEFEEAGLKDTFKTCRKRLSGICRRRRFRWWGSVYYNWCTTAQLATRTGPQINELLTCVGSILEEVYMYSHWFKLTLTTEYLTAMCPCRQ